MAFLGGKRKYDALKVDVAEPERESAVPVLSRNVEYTHTRVLVTPPQRLREKRVISGFADDPVADTYRILRTQMLLRMRREGWGSIGVTSPTAGCGSTLTAVNLSISLAQDINHTVLLVDLDLRNPGVHSYFTDESVRGLSDYLLDNEIPDLLFNPGINRLVVLPGNQPIAESSEFLSSPRMVDMVNEVKSRYESRLTVFDLPPVLSSDDVMVVSPHVDVLLMVIEDGKTSRDELARAMEMLKGVNVIGTVLNKSGKG